MRRSAQWPDIWLVVLGSISLIAWFLLLRPGDGLVVPVLCSASSLQALPSLVSFNLAVSLGGSAQLASDWALMVAAMMPPLVITSLRHVRDRSFARRRARATLLFLLGYVLVWITAGFVLQAMTLAARWAVPRPLLCFGVVVAIAILWQVSPAKQLCLNRCHRRPHLAAFDLGADRDVFTFGLMNGAWCVGSCWALMLALVASQGHALGMVAVTLFAFGERLEGPAPLAWRWRVPFKALRIAAAQAGLRLRTQGRTRRLLRWTPRGLAASEGKNVAVFTPNSAVLHEKG
jgi:predicted metal-binding membrane protein